MRSERIAAKRRAYVKESPGVQARRDQGGKEKKLCVLRAEVYSSARIIWGDRGRIRLAGLPRVGASLCCPSP